MGFSSIEWTDVTDNIIVAVDEKGQRHGWWCRKISPGCLNCYAEKLNQSDYFKGNHLKYAGAPPVLKLREDVIDAWARQRKPRRHFVASMTDIFGDWVPQSWIFRFMDGMRAAPLQTFQLLTKRADIMNAQIWAWLDARGLKVLPRNICPGITTERQIEFDERFSHLALIPAYTYFVSYEPALSALRLPYMALTLGPQLQVIPGGESGPNARPPHPEWFRALREQRLENDFRLFFKQWGEWIDGEQSAHHAPYRKDIETIHNWRGPDGVVEAFSLRIGKKKAGRLLDGREWNEFPEAA